MQSDGCIYVPDSTGIALTGGHKPQPDPLKRLAQHVAAHAKALFIRIAGPFLAITVRGADGSVRLHAGAFQGG